MKATEAEPTLRRMLSEAGFDFSNPSPMLAWQVFKAFAGQPVKCADDGLLFECGVYEFTGEPLFHFDLCRQFEIEVNGEYDHMEQLHCRLTCKPTEALKSLETNLWAYDFQSMPAFFDAVENLPEFKTAVAHPTWQCEVEQNEV
ncbi:hypothetical protein Pla8534_46330 [Lignipirellula cremea]|uniref:Uncharacterized protein n=2 Tax=Lignipirellula cremea TaxID=2528010 RepID=A0A518DYD2_9BACT|nr:hypothetical protein Pla8534_46330 [Lignipirellula cremea]